MTGGARLRAARHPVTLLAAGWALLLIAWAMANPPFAAPDEPAHYLRAVAVGGGSLRATPIVDVPTGLWARWRDRRGPTCNAGERHVPASCLEDYEQSTRPIQVETTAGGYPPPAYVLPGLALRAMDDLSSAARAARLAGAGVTLAFLVLAALLLFARGAPLESLVGLAVGVTPMVMFVGASIGNSGLEIGAATALAAALLRLTRAGPRPWWVWASAAVAVGALGFARTTGVLWIGLDLALAGALLWAARTRAGGRDLRRPLVVLGAVALVAVVANRLWEGAYGWSLTQRGATDYGAIGGKLAHGVQQLRRVLDEQMGVFGSLDAPMPHGAYPLAQALLAALLAVAVLVAARRETMVLAATAGAYAVVVVVLSASLVAATETDVQGRHVLPFAIVLPMLAGELLLRNRAKLESVSPRPLAAGLVVATAGLHLVAWLTSAYRQSVGTRGPLFFFSDPAWSPPLGWWPWTMVAAAGAGLVAAMAVSSRPAGAGTRAPRDVGRTDRLQPRLPPLGVTGERQGAAPRAAERPRP